MAEEVVVVAPPKKQASNLVTSENLAEFNDARLRVQKPEPAKEAKPAEGEKPVEAKPAEKPAEAKPAEAKPGEKPAEAAKPAEPGGEEVLRIVGRGMWCRHSCRQGLGLIRIRSGNMKSNTLSGGSVGYSPLGAGETVTSGPNPVRP